CVVSFCFFFQAEDGIRDFHVTGVQTCALPIYHSTRDQEGMGHKGRGVLNLALSKDGKVWEAALILDYIDEPEKQYSYPSIIQTSDGLVHIVYTWHRERIKHVVVDPNQLVTFPIIDGQWPLEDIPLVVSTEQ